MPRYPLYPPVPGLKINSTLLTSVHYEIIEQLGRGGAGLTYKAVEKGGKNDGAMRVVKLPNLDIDKHSIEEIRTRIEKVGEGIQNEMEALRDLDETEGIAPITDVGGMPWQVGKGKANEIIRIFHTIYDYIDGDDLDKWCEKNYSNDEGIFEGIPDVDVWFDLARDLFEILDRVHHQRIVHGDLWPPNIRILPNGKPIIIDFGQAWSLERVFEMQADTAKPHEYLAPERYAMKGRISKWYATADIYSMGGVLFYLATGQRPPSPWNYKTGGNTKPNRVIKQEVVSAIQARNPQLYKSNLGIADVILTCLCPNLENRARHASVVIETINAFDYRTYSDNPGNVSIEKALREVGVILKDLRTVSYSTNPIFKKIVSRRINSLRDDLSPLRSRVFSIEGDREVHINSMLDCFSVLRNGDEVTAVTTARFWKKGNFGPHGRLSSMLSMAAQRGAIINWIVLADENLDSEDKDVLEYQKINVKEFLECCESSALSPAKVVNLNVHYLLLSESELDRVRRLRDTFIMARCADNWTLIVPDYSDASGAISVIRLWADPTRRETFLTNYENYLAKSIPIIDFNL